MKRIVPAWVLMITRGVCGRGQGELPAARRDWVVKAGHEQAPCPLLPGGADEAGARAFAPGPDNS
jgi:hypothetical protein